MAITSKNDESFSSNNKIKFNGQIYKADFIIKFPVKNDDINLENCVCVFSILNRSNLLFRQYVGAKFYTNLTNDNVIENINGFLPESIFCFTDTDFPLSEFLAEHDFQHYNS